MFDSFDWPGHFEAAFDIAFHGPFAGRCFFVSLEFATGQQCKELLAGRGIEIYGEDVQRGYALFWVLNEDAERAWHILTETGIPVGVVGQEVTLEEERERWPGAWDGVTVGGVAEDGSLIWIPWERKDDGT